MKKRDQHIAPIANVLVDVAKDLGLSRQFEIRLRLAQWEEIAGPQIAAHSEPLRLKGKTLYLRVRDPAWAVELEFMTEEILASIRKHLGEKAVEKIRYEVGPLEHCESFRSESFQLDPPADQDVLAGRELVSSQGLALESDLGESLAGLIATCRRLGRTRRR